MRHTFALALTVAIAAFGLASTAAGAASLEVSPAGSIIETSLGKLSFTAGENTVECNITMSGNLLRGPIAKTSGSKLGEINSVRWANCSGGEIERVEGLPWTVSYESISGTLPERMTSVTKKVAIDIDFSLFGSFFECEYKGIAAFAVGLVNIASNVYKTGLASSLQSAIPLLRGFACPVDGRIKSQASLTIQTVTRN
ncbi:MAG TPA: hypothetical protein VFU94_13415 [Conexibacter sp.]|nr:hypothetical protein [Conexibacter sp.]